VSRFNLLLKENFIAPMTAKIKNKSARQLVVKNTGTLNHYL
jgi:hypothetical protein